MSQFIRYPARVTSINGISGDLTLVAGSNITITPLGQTLTIAATGGGGGSGFDTLGTFDAGVASAAGLNASGTTLFAQSASATLPGMVNTTAQTFTGDKTFNDHIVNTSLTANRAMVTSGGSILTTSATTATELGYVNGVTSEIQPQLNAKQASGNYITALTGDGTAAGPGSSVLTLATVNSNVGSFTYGSFTVNAKGLITAASSGSPPVASVTSVALSVPGSSLFGITGSPVTSIGTLGLTTTGTSGGIPYFSSTSALSSSALLTANALVLGGGAASAPVVLGSLGTTSTVLHGNAAGAPTFAAVALTTDVSGQLPIGNGGTGQATKAAGFDALSPMTTGGDIVYGGASGTGTRLANGSSGAVLTSAGGTAAPTWTSPTVQMPIGGICMWGTASAPTNYLICNNTAVSRTTYATLFALIGTTFGVGDGSTTFNLPGFPGVVPRGVGTATINARTKTGPSLGAFQEDQFQGHFHSYQRGNFTTDYTAGINRVGTLNDSPVNSGSPISDGSNGTPRTGSETQASALGINFIIRYQ